MEPDSKKQKLWDYLEKWKSVLPTKLHLDTFLANNHKMSEEDKELFIQLWNKLMNKEEELCVVDECQCVHCDVDNCDCDPCYCVNSGDCPQGD